MMTTGQRISAKRKELNLSQEALGEALGVSRQSIYKWESDASLPEIDKLVALSRRFGVSVGWLLGVEEESESPASESGELSEAQLQMVEEILHRYRQEQQHTLTEEQQAQVEAMVAERLAAQPKAKRRRWPYVLAAVLLVFAGFNLFDRLERLDNRYNNLQYSINNVSTDVNRQINSITNRVEEVLKSQNHLTADYDTEFVAADLGRNTVTFSARTVPKTYVEGMEVYFLIDSGDGPAEIAGTMGPGREFTAELTCELTDNIVISAVFVNGDTRQTQLLDSYGGLYSTSLPGLDLQYFESTYLHRDILLKDGIYHLPSDFGCLQMASAETKLGTVNVDTASIQVGLFKNFELYQWLEPCEKPANYNTHREGIISWYHLPEIQMELKTGDILHFAAIYKDEYGRPGVAASIPAFECFGDEISWMASSDATDYFDISNYSY